MTIELYENTITLFCELSYIRLTSYNYIAKLNISGVENSRSWHPLHTFGDSDTR